MCIRPERNRLDCTNATAFEKCRVKIQLAFTLSSPDFLQKSLQASRLRSGQATNLLHSLLSGKRISFRCNLRQLKNLLLTITRRFVELHAVLYANDIKITTLNNFKKSFSRGLTRKNADLIFALSASSAKSAAKFSLI